MESKLFQFRIFAIFFSLSPISTRVLYAFALGDIYLSELDIFNLIKNVENVQGVYLCGIWIHCWKINVFQTWIHFQKYTSLFPKLHAIKRCQKRLQRCLKMVVILWFEKVSLWKWELQCRWNLRDQGEGGHSIPQLFYLAGPAELV